MVDLFLAMLAGFGLGVLLMSVLYMSGRDEWP